MKIKTSKKNKHKMFVIFHKVILIIMIYGYTNDVITHINIWIIFCSCISFIIDTKQIRRTSYSRYNSKRIIVKLGEEGTWTKIKITVFLSWKKCDRVEFVKQKSLKTKCIFEWRNKCNLFWPICLNGKRFTYFGFSYREIPCETSHVYSENMRTYFKKG